MATEPQLSAQDDPATKLGKRVKKLSVGLVVVFLLLIGCTGSLVFLFMRRAKAIDEVQQELRFKQFVAAYEDSTDFVTPDINTIQFLRRGYSIIFDSVQYTQNGLVLSGNVGNPTQLWISSLALNVSARPYPYKIRDKWLKDGYQWSWWNDDWSLGKGQTTVGTLSPGTSTPFHVTIPNVKQTSDNIQIAVWFSGERYLYLGK